MAEQNPSEMPTATASLHRFVVPADVFETYADALNLSTNGDTVTFTFGVRGAPDDPPIARAIIRMSPQFAHRVATVVDALVKRLDEAETQDRAKTE